MSRLFLFSLLVALTAILGFLYVNRSVGITPIPAKLNNSPLTLNGTKLENSYCSATAEEVDSGAKDMLTVLNKITSRPYFRYFKVNSEKPCPYWAVSLLCTSAENTCDVCSCDEKSIPEALRVSYDMSDVRTPGQHVSQISPHPINIEEWGNWKNLDEGAEYVDLVENPEGNTGYSGFMAMKVWQAIYNDNCLAPPAADDKCNEINVLHTLLSGLHSSINMHVCTNFYKDPELKSPQAEAGIYSNPSISFFPNCEMYLKRVAPFPQFIENMYVLYQFTLRALAKAKPLLLSDVNTFNSGAGGSATAEDRQLHDDIHELFNSKLLCVKTFDETAFLETEKGRELVPEMKRMMWNVTRLMDCVTCQKCRIWSKLQTKGISTALKIITEPEDNGTLSLDRAEKVTLINLVRQLAFSVYNAQRLAVDCQNPSSE